MYCKNCLAPLAQGDTYCKVCGKPVDPASVLPEKPKEESPIIFPDMNEVKKAETSNFVARPIPQHPQPTPPVASSQPQQEPVPHPIPVQPIPEPVGTVSPVGPKPPEVGVPRPGGKPAPAPEGKPLEEVGKPVPPPPVPPKKEIPQPIAEGGKKKPWILIVIIAVVAAVAVTLLITVPIFSKKVDDAKKESTPSTNSPTTTVTQAQVTFGGYRFVIPEGYTYKIAGTQFIVEKIDTKEAMALQVATDTYSNIKTNMATLKTNLTTAKWTVGKLQEATPIKNRYYFTVEATVNNKKLMIAYTKASATQVFGIVYLNPNNTDYPTSTIETFNTIVDSATPASEAPTTNIGTYTTNAIFFAAKK